MALRAIGHYHLKQNNMADTTPQDVPVISPTGEYGSIPDGFQPEALSQGYKIADKADIQNQADKEAYGTTVQSKINAFAEGSVKGLTYPFGEKVLNALGTKEEVIRAHEKFLPGFSNIGQLTGLGVQAMAPFATPISAINKVGEAIKGFNLGAGLTGIPKLANIANQVAGSAIEGALFMGGDAFNESALGDDPSLVAQKALSQAGTGLLLGGAGGALFGTAKAGKEIIDAAMDTTVGKGIRAAMTAASLAIHPYMTTAEYFADKALRRAMGEILPEGVGTAGIGTAIGAADKKIVDYGNEVDSRVQKYQFLRPVEDLVGKADRQINSLSNGVFKDTEGEIPEVENGSLDTRNKFEEKKAILDDFKNNQESMENFINDKVGYLMPHAPNLSNATLAVAGRAVNFLASKVPSPQPAGPLSQPTVDNAAIQKFNRYYNAVNKPLSALKQIQNNTITPEAREAIKTVHPQLYQDLYTRMIEGVAKHGKNIPFQKRLAIGTFLGIDLDGSRSPMSLMSNQQVFAVPSQQAANQGIGGGKPTQKGLSTIDKASMMSTPFNGGNRRDEP
jgi:hypothetical protein